MKKIDRLWVILPLFFCVLPLTSYGSEGKDDDLYELASDAADEEVEKAGEVLEKENQTHGEQWLTRKRLITLACVWLAFQVLMLTWVVRDCRKRRKSVPATLGWVVLVVLLGVIGFILFEIRKRRWSGMNNEGERSV